MSRKPKKTQPIDPTKTVVTVHYWYNDWSADTGLAQGQEFPYSDLPPILEKLLRLHLYVFFKSYVGDDGVSRTLMAIDTRPFTQR